MNASERTTGARRSGALVVRLSLMACIVGFALFGARELWGRVLPVIKPVARDYLSFQRVERHRDVLLKAARESGVDPYLLAAIMLVESSGRVDARSQRDALGLFQLTTVTADWRAEKLGLPPPTEAELLSDPLLNARLGANNMAWLLDTYDGHLEKALIAYNAGAGRLAQYVRRAGSYEAWRKERVAAGNSELLAYVARVLDYRQRFEGRGLFDGARKETIPGR